MQTYWENRFVNQTSITWGRVWQLQTIKLSPERILSEFGFKILHGILLNMSNLYKWKLVPTPLCAVCLVPEDIEHMFISCKSLGHFWKQVDNFTSNVKLGFVGNLSNIILGLSTSEDNRHIQKPNSSNCQVGNF